MDDLFKKALDQPTAPVSTRVWSTIQPLLPKPWYLQAWIGWLVAFLSLGGLGGMTYQVVQIKKEVQKLQSTSAIRSRIDTVYVSRVDTLYILNNASGYPVASTELRAPTHWVYRDTNQQLEQPNAISSPIKQAAESSSRPTSNLNPTPNLNESLAPEMIAEEGKRQQETSNETNAAELAVNESSKSPESIQEPVVDTKENRTQRPLTSDIRLVVSPAVSTQGSWSTRWVAEWEIRQKWAVGTGFQTDFYPEYEYDRVVDFTRVYGRPPNQVYAELADISNSVQQRMEDIEIQRAVFSVPLYARYYFEGSRNWRFYPEVGYRINVWTRERVDVDIDTETGHDFRLFTAKNPTQQFSKAFIGAGVEWQNRGWAFQAGSRWVSQEGISFQVGVAKSLFGKNQSKLWRF